MEILSEQWQNYFFIKINTKIKNFEEVIENYFKNKNNSLKQNCFIIL